MLHVLLESSGRRHSRPAGWTLTSVAIHAALIAAAVALTLRETRPDVERIPLAPIIYTSPRPMAPAPATSTASQSTVISDPLPSLPVLRVPVVPPMGIPPITGNPRIDVTEFGTGVAPNTGGNPGPASGIHTVATVDRIVMPRADNPSPDYPASLRSASVEGEVLVQFVVDTTGRVVPASITILRATHGLFGDSVRRWLLRTRYTPAEAGGRLVSQLVQQPIGFSLRR